jgi:hypothetical protein
MPIPAAYDETSLAEFMHNELGPVAKVLGYTEPNGNAGVYQEAVNEVMLALGVTDLLRAPDIRKVRALARRQAWTMANNGLATKYDYSADGASYNRSQMFTQVKQALDRAIGDCMALGLDGYSASIDTVEFKYDPYTYPRNVEDLC